MSAVSFKNAAIAIASGLLVFTGLIYWDPLGGEFLKENSPHIYFSKPSVEIQSRNAADFDIAKYMIASREDGKNLLPYSRISFPLSDSDAAILAFNKQEHIREARSLLAKLKRTNKWSKSEQRVWLCEVSTDIKSLREDVSRSELAVNYQAGERLKQNFETVAKKADRLCEDGKPKK